MRRTLIALAVLLLLPSTAAAATLEVRIPGEEPTSVDLAALPADVRDQDYDGTRVSGVALGTALTEGQAPSFALQGVTVGNGTEVLTLGAADAYPGDAEARPPVLVTEGEGVRLLLADGRQVDAPGGTLTADVALREQQENARNARFPISVSPRRPEPGERVRLRVDAPRSGATYRWTIRGRSDRPFGASVTHRFREAGRFAVQVFDQDRPEFGTDTVVVGNPEPADEDAGTGGPAGSGGTSSGDAGGTSPGSGLGSAGVPGDLGGGAAGVPPAGVPPAVPSAAPDIPAPTPTPSPTATPEPAASGGVPVEGELLGDAVLVAQAVPAEALAEAATEREDAQASLRIPTGAWVLAGTLVLGWFGWGLDNLRARPRWS